LIPPQLAALQTIWAHFAVLQGPVKQRHEPFMGRFVIQLLPRISRHLGVEEQVTDREARELGKDIEFENLARDLRKNLDEKRATELNGAEISMLEAPAYSISTCSPEQNTDERREGDQRQKPVRHNQQSRRYLLRVWGRRSSTVGELAPYRDDKALGTEQHKDRPGG
jgi:hypothetical protein